MAIIVKCNPPAVSPGGFCVVEERIYYQAQPQPGEVVYVWEAETAGGRGLAMRGHIEHVQILGDRAELHIGVDPNRAAGSLNVEILAPHRNTGGQAALSGLARKLYRHAHNKIAPLTADEVNFVQEFF